MKKVLVTRSFHGPRRKKFWPIPSRHDQASLVDLQLNTCFQKKLNWICEISFRLPCFSLALHGFCLLCAFSPIGLNFFCLCYTFLFALSFSVCVVSFVCVTLCLRCAFLFALRYFLRCAFLFALCFFVWVGIFWFASCFFVCVVHFCLRCVFLFTIFYFQMLFSLRYAFWFVDVWCVFAFSLFAYIKFNFNLLMFGFFSAFSFFVCVGRLGPP